MHLHLNQLAIKSAALSMAKSCVARNVSERHALSPRQKVVSSGGS
jgi:hypothetical protein